MGEVVVGSFVEVAVVGIYCIKVVDGVEITGVDVKVLTVIEFRVVINIGMKLLAAVDVTSVKEVVVKFEEFIDASNEVVEIYFTVVAERVNGVVHGDKVLIVVEEGFVINVGMKLEAEVVIFVSVIEFNVVDEMDTT